MDNDTFDRRRALGLLAGLGGAVTLGGSALLGKTLLAGTPAAAPANAMARLPWPYRRVDPDAAGQRAFEGYKTGHCMFGAFDAIAGAVAEQLGAPYTGFPFQMFIYGMGGVYGWGTLCGTLNGCAAAIQVLSPNPGPVVDELFRWYENTLLPDFEPKGMKFKTVKSLAGSPLCHPSIAKWCEASGKKAYSAERDERCGVLAASVARHCAMLLNAQAAGKLLPVTAVDGRTKACMGCHEKGGPMENMRSKQTCAPCHSDESLDLNGHQKINL
ncbi:MAG: C-GCAxxG-C-C family protein [Holophaga sp.]|nr:C-GCAxxG-C-C family protein [Holophaga sp.]